MDREGLESVSRFLRPVDMSGWSEANGRGHGMGMDQKMITIAKPSMGLE